MNMNTKDCQLLSELFTLLSAVLKIKSDIPKTDEVKLRQRFRTIITRYQRVLSEMALCCDETGPLHELIDMQLKYYEGEGESKTEDSGKSGRRS